MEKYWQNAHNLENYFKISEERAHNNPNKKDDFQQYYELGLTRMNRALKTTLISLLVQGLRG